MSARTWRTTHYEREHLGYVLYVHIPEARPDVWLWTVYRWHRRYGQHDPRRYGRVLARGEAKRAWQAKLYARRAAESLAREVTP